MISNQQLQYFQQRKSQDQMASSVNSMLRLKKELTLNFLKLFQNIEGEESLSTPSYGAQFQKHAFGPLPSPAHEQ